LLSIEKKFRVDLRRVTISGWKKTGAVENHPDILTAEDHQEWQELVVFIAENCPPQTLRR